MFSPTPTQAAVVPPHAASNAVRYLGQFQLLRLLAKSARTLLWLVSDGRSNQELVLAMPRSQPANAAALQRWLDNAQRCARIDHPGLAQVIEVGEHERWPFVVYDRNGGETLLERLSNKGFAPAELVPWALRVVEGLAFAHEAGMGHHDIQAGTLLLSDSGECRLLGLGVALPADFDAGGLPEQRRAAERDVLALGLVVHHALIGVPALDQADTNLVIDRLPPLGREIVRLPWGGVHPIPDALRAIVNRATDRQERQRYRSARTLERALNGWLRTDGDSGGGPIMLLLDRMRAAGLLPAMPGGPARASRLLSLEREGSAELSAIVIQDIGLSFELLRQVNGGKLRSGAGGSNGPILTIRRAIEMLGLEGVRRASTALRPWPGPLSAAHAADLDRLIAQVRLAGRVAQALRPAGYDAEVTYLLAMLQNLGRLAVQYHFPEEAAQVRRLMQPGTAPRPGEAEDPGMSEEGASFAVLGVDIDVLGHAVARHWGLEDEVLHMVRRVPPSAPVHQAEADGDQLRLSACCANEAVDTLLLLAPRRAAALQKVVQRYGRVLGLTLQDLLLALQDKPPTDPAAGQDTAPAPTADGVPQ